MANGDDATDTAAQRLRQLHTFFLEHPAAGPSTGRIAGSRTPAAPLNLGTLDYIHATVAEVVEHTRDVNPEAGPLPERVEAVYDWCRQHTEHADDVQQQRRETLEVRHRLEHAVRAGDGSVVRPMRCPDCGTVGLFWQAHIWRAVCVNRHCAATNQGVSRSFTLAKLAYEQVAARKKLRQARAT